MTFIFKNALVRKASNNIVKALSSKKLDPSFEKINNEHNEYIRALKKSALNVIIFEPLNDFPDSIFVEDPGLIYNNNYISLRPADKTRFGESAVMKNEVKKLFEKIFSVNHGNIEGGDILRINDHFIIGLSSRTNHEGANSLSRILNTLGASVEISKTPTSILHFKSECSLIDEDTILLTEKMSKNDIFKKHYKFVKIPIGEEIAANSLRVNNNLLIPSGCPKTKEMLSKSYNLIPLDVDEVFKVDAGLSCMSLRW